MIASDEDPFVEALAEGLADIAAEGA